MLKKVCAVIVTFNGEQFIKDAIESLINSEYPVEIIVVDNASKDRTLEVIESINSEIQINRMSSNLGFGKANNIGIGISLRNSAEFIFLINQDAKVYPGTIGNLVKVAESDSKIGIVSPVHLNWNGDSIDFDNGAYYAKISEFFMNDLFKNNMKNYYDIKFMPAAIWLVRSEIFTQVGGFDPLFKHRGEDVDFAARVHHWGYRIVLSLNSYASHFHEGIKRQRDFKFIFMYCTHESIFNLKLLDRSLIRSILIDIAAIGGRLLMSVALGRKLFVLAQILFLIYWPFLLLPVMHNRNLCKKGGPLWMLT